MGKEGQESLWPSCRLGRCGGVHVHGIQLLRVRVAQSGHEVVQAQACVSLKGTLVEGRVSTRRRGGGASAGRGTGNINSILSYILGNTGILLTVAQP